MPRRRLSRPRGWPACLRARSPGASTIRPAPSITCSRTSTTWCCTSRRACWTPSTSACSRPAQDGDPWTASSRLAQAYLAFTHEKPRLWNLLFEHHMPTEQRASRPGISRSSKALMGRVEEALAPLFAAGQRGGPPARRARAVGRRARHHLAVDGRQAVGRDHGERQPAGRRSGRHLSRRPARQAAARGAGTTAA